MNDGSCRTLQRLITREPSAFYPAQDIERLFRCVAPSWAYAHCGRPGSESLATERFWVDLAPRFAWRTATVVDIKQRIDSRCVHQPNQHLFINDVVVNKLCGTSLRSGSACFLRMVLKRRSSPRRSPPQ
jgi:hypothetical protein